jgi:calpain-15
VRLVSFCEAGFVMGLATAFGGGGLVGGHAYSVLDVVEVHNSVVGEQCKLTDYFTVKSNKPTTSSELSASTGDLKSTLYPSSPAKCARGDRTTVRLVRIRNPWGAKEWKGDWSAESERWTTALRKKLKGSWNKGDGTFFMSFEDVLQRFHHLDVAKTREVSPCERECLRSCASAVSRNSLGATLFQLSCRVGFLNLWERYFDKLWLEVWNHPALFFC